MAVSFVREEATFLFVREIGVEEEEIREKKRGMF